MKPMPILILCLMLAGITSYAHEHRDPPCNHGHRHHSDVITVYEDVWVPGYDEYVLTCHGVRIVHHCGYWTRVVRYIRR